MASSAELLDTTVRHQVYLERLKSNQANQFTAFLKQIDVSLKARLTNNDITLFTRNRLERLISSVEQDLNVIFDNYYDELSGNLLDIGLYESEFEAKALTDAIADFESVIPAATQISAAITSAPLSVRGADGGKLLDSFISDWSSSEKKALTGAIRQGFYEGQTNFQIIQRLRGTKANKYTDGLLNITSRHAESIVRTSVQHVASVSRFETWKANEDVVTGYRWVSTLDDRTSSQCRSLDNQVFKLGKGPVPPIHIRCRSTTIAELNGRYSFLKEGRTRASSEGYQSGDQTFYGWLKKQPANFQDSIIGKSRGALLRSGGLTSSRFAKLNLGRNFKPLTLEQMREIEPLAFERAGI